MEMELKYEIKLPITKIGYPSPNGLILEPESYRKAIEEYIDGPIKNDMAIITNGSVELNPDGGIIRIDNGCLGDLIGKITNIDIDEGIATVIVKKEFKDLNGEGYRLMAALLGNRDEHLFVVKRLLQYFIVPKPKYTNWGF